MSFQNHPSRTRGCIVSNKLKPFRRFSRKLRRLFWNGVPNTGPKEIDLSRLNRYARQTGFESSYTWRIEMPSELSGRRT
jgi:hypothetical protein